MSTYAAPFADPKSASPSAPAIGVCDAWLFLDEVAEPLLQKADHVLVVTTLERLALRNPKRFLEHLARSELTRERVTLALNRFPVVNNIALQDMQKRLRYPVGANILSAGQPITHSVNCSMTIVMVQRRSWACQSLLRPAAHVAGDGANLIALKRSGEQKGREVLLLDVEGRRSLLSMVRATSWRSCLSHLVPDAAHRQDDTWT
ncbi:MAG: hypothetical protein RMJ54_17125 [Roseiflexaceae bacterium]|nr:hypothetical protein [Roseiflexaceae bacterium]MDW8234498.1 hypothetical protein [Roseiflexaceae bacterium]